MKRTRRCVGYERFCPRRIGSLSNRRDPNTSTRDAFPAEKGHEHVVDEHRSQDKAKHLVDEELASSRRVHVPIEKMYQRAHAVMNKHIVMAADRRGTRLGLNVPDWNQSKSVWVKNRSSPGGRESEEHDHRRHERTRMARREHPRAARSCDRPHQHRTREGNAGINQAHQACVVIPSHRTSSALTEDAGARSTRDRETHDHRPQHHQHEDTRWPPMS